MQGRYVPSLLAAIGDIVERHLSALGSRGQAKQEMEFAHPFTPTACPQCGAAKLVKVEGCNNCLDCGYSKCG
jgi:ribonucleoside-diphosphate reductase alpha chain